MKKNHLLHSSAAAIFSLLASQFAAATPAPPSTSVTYGGSTYYLTTSYTNYASSTPLLESQPWWGNSALAGQLANLVQTALGDYDGNYPSSDNNGVLFAYALDSDAIHMQFWNGSAAENCPGCPEAADNYAYAILSKVLAAYTLADAQSSILATESGVSLSLNTTSLLMNGAHSRPMSRRVAANEKTFWVAGDWGNDNHGYRDGSLGLAEIGGGYNFGPAQVNVSLGKTWADQNLIHSGDISSDGKYLMVEGILPLSIDNGVYATIGTYRYWGDIDIRRGYFNMGSLDASSANPDSNSWGVRARIDWENAFMLNKARFSPYADLSYNKTKLDGYTEMGGGFPAEFDSRKDSITELRVGLNSALPIKESGFDFVTNIEAVHRFDEHAASTSGQVVGLFAFNLDGQDYDQNWLKGGIGAEGKLGQGKVSLMLNGTTEGEMPSSWFAASYQLYF